MKANSMRIALLSDIHGNPIALDVVLADVAAQGGVDTYWVLGDLVAIGYDPAAVLARLAALPNARFVRGNTDRYTVEGTFPPKDLDVLRQNTAKIEAIIQIAQSFAWTRGYVASTGMLDWLADLPLEQRMTLPDGTRLLCVHAAPGTDDGDGIAPTTSDDMLRSLLNGCGADVLCVGHTHWPIDRQVDGVRVINLGSVSNPLAPVNRHPNPGAGHNPPEPDLRASYVLLEANETGYALQHRRVAYDHQAVIGATKRSRHPGADYITSFQLGERRPAWE
jgi:putative phosphoesterase